MNASLPHNGLQQPFDLGMCAWSPLRCPATTGPATRPKRPDICESSPSWRAWRAADMESSTNADDSGERYVVTPAMTSFAYVSTRALRRTRATATRSVTRTRAGARRCTSDVSASDRSIRPSPAIACRPSTRSTFRPAVGLDAAWRAVVEYMDATESPASTGVLTIDPADPTMQNARRQITAEQHVAALSMPFDPTSTGS